MRELPFQLYAFTQGFCSGGLVERTRCTIDYLHSREIAVFFLDLSRGCLNSVVENFHDIFIIQHLTAAVCFELVCRHEIRAYFCVLDIVLDEVFYACSGVVAIRCFIRKQAFHHLSTKVESFPYADDAVSMDSIKNIDAQHTLGKSVERHEPLHLRRPSSSRASPPLRQYHGSVVPSHLDYPSSQIAI